MRPPAPRPPTTDEPQALPLRVVRRRYHLHIPGVVYVLTTLLMAVGAINSQNNLLFWAFGLAVTALIVSGLLSGAALMGLEVRREAIPETSVGDRLAIRYRLRNRNRFVPAFGLTIAESDRTLAGHAPPAWPVHAAPPRAFVIELGPRRSVTVEASAPALRRGEPTFDAIIVSTTFPFGLTRKSVTLTGPSRTIVRPRHLNLRRDLLDSLVRRGDHAGSSRRFSPAGDQFFALREYRPGDNPRAIAWRATARTGQWLIRTHTAPGPRRLWILIDALESDGERAETAISLAASLAVAAHDDGYLVGVCLPAAGLIVAPRHSPSASRHLLNALAVAKWSPVPDPSARLPAIALRESVVVIQAGPTLRAAGAPPGSPSLFAERVDDYLAPSGAQGPAAPSSVKSPAKASAPAPARPAATGAALPTPGAAA